MNEIETISTNEVVDNLKTQRTPVNEVLDSNGNINNRTSDYANDQQLNISADKPLSTDGDDDYDDDAIRFTDWGFSIEKLFEIAHSFYKRNEGKAFYPSFDARNKLHALVVQAKFGNFEQSKSPDIGTLDLVGRGRRNEWALLNGMSKKEAMTKFIYTLDELCPIFKAHAKAIQISSDSQQEINGHDTNDKGLSNGTVKESRLAVSCSKDDEEQLKAIHENLCRQTYSQFKQYAQGQHPDDPASRKKLISTLQEQYFQQYVSQMNPDLASKAVGILDRKNSCLHTEQLEESLKNCDMEQPTNDHQSIDGVVINLQKMELDNSEENSTLSLDQTQVCNLTSEMDINPPTSSSKPDIPGEQSLDKPGMSDKVPTLENYEIPIPFNDSHIPFQTSSKQYPKLVSPNTVSLSGSMHLVRQNVPAKSQYQLPRVESELVVGYGLNYESQNHDQISLADLKPQNSESHEEILKEQDNCTTNIDGSVLPTESFPPVPRAAFPPEHYYRLRLEQEQGYFKQQTAQSKSHFSQDPVTTYSLPYASDSAAHLSQPENKIKQDYTETPEIDRNQIIQPEPQDEPHCQVASWGYDENVNPNQGDADTLDQSKEDSDDTCSSGTGSPLRRPSVTYEPLEPALTWTKSGRSKFKDSLVNDRHGGAYVVSQGVLLTIKVPTYPDGRHIYWEFATDDYDVGFGLDFVYDFNMTEPLSISTFERYDEDDLDDEEQDEDDDGDLDENHLQQVDKDGQHHKFEKLKNKENEIEDENGNGNGIENENENEKNKNKKANEKKQDKMAQLGVSTLMILPTYRRDSHEEIQCGQHRYPGPGFYLLKFDNTYSVLRSKSLYFRICYFM